MKKTFLSLLLTAALMGGCVVTQERVTTQEEEYIRRTAENIVLCEEVAEVARKIVGARDEGVRREALLSMIAISDRPQEIRELSTVVVHGAYNDPSITAEEMRLEVLGTCYQQF